MSLYQLVLNMLSLPEGFNTGYIGLSRKESQTEAFELKFNGQKMIPEETISLKVEMLLSPELVFIMRPVQ